MKLKKILALVCSVAMSASLFVSTAVVADAAGATATLEFAGYETAGTTTFAKIVVKATIPETLVPYEEVEPDWENTFDYSYSGLMLQGIGFDIPYVDGLQFIKAKSVAEADFVTITDNKNGSKATLSYAATGGYDTYYTGTVDTLATLYYRITGDVNATYNVALSSAKIGLVTVNADGSVTPYEHVITDITNATVKPASTKVPATSVALAEPGEGEELDTTSDAAVAYKVEKTFTTGQTAYWTATINGAAKKLNRELANLDGTSSVGLIITGDATISNVALNVVTSN